MASCRAELTWTADDLISPDYRFQVAEFSEGEISGFYAIDRLAADDFELEALFVLPRYIGTGVGRALMAHAITLTTRLGGRRLVIQSDPNAEAFYRSAGAVVVGNRESASIPGRMLPVLQVTLPLRHESGARR